MSNIGSFNPNFSKQNYASDGLCLLLDVRVEEAVPILSRGVQNGSNWNAAQSDLIEDSRASCISSSSNSDTACVRQQLLGNGRESVASALVDGLRHNLEPGATVSMVLKSGDGVRSEPVQQNVTRILGLTSSA